MSNDNAPQAAAVDLMAQTMLTHLLETLQDKGILSGAEVDSIFERSDREMIKDLNSGKFAEAATE